VNIVRKGTAVVPVVEVRDRNNLPVAGALVTFMIPGGSKAATFANSARQIAVTTDSAGRASASGIQAVGKGAFRIEINASYQGQTATTSISQSNFASVAEAAKAGKTPGSQSGSSGSSSSSGGSSVSGSAGAAGTAAGTAAGAGAGAGGGGLSTGLIVGVAAAGAGAVAGAIYIPRLIEDATGPQCTSQENSVTNAVTNFSNASNTFLTCASNSRVAACTAQLNAYNSAISSVFAALGDYCTCLGPEFSAQITAQERQAIQQYFADARAQGINVGTLPACYR
jgi:hypothetical protein